MKPRTILHVIASLQIGGAEKQLALLVRDTDRSRYSPRIACTTRPGPLLEEIVRDGTPVELIGKRGRFDASLLWRLGRHIRRLKPDLVHTWMFTANTWGRLAALAARLPTPRGNPPALVASERCVDLWKGSLHRGIDRALARVTHRIIANSAAVAGFLERREGIPLSRIRIIPNGFDPAEGERLRPRSIPESAALRQSLGVPPEARVVGDVARLDAKNDLLCWVAVVERLSRRLPGLVALLAGAATLPAERRYARSVEEEIRRRGLEDRVRLLGLRRDLENLLPALDLFLHTSATEGFPNCVMEAMAAGLPVVATAAGGTPELVADGRTGFLAPVGDVDALAARALQLLENPALRRSLGEAGARRVRDEFSLRRTVAATEAVYEEALLEAGK